MVAAAVILSEEKADEIEAEEVVVGRLAKRAVAVDVANLEVVSVVEADTVRIVGVRQRKMAAAAAEIGPVAGHPRPSAVAAVPSSWKYSVAPEMSVRALVATAEASRVVEEDAPS